LAPIALDIETAGDQLFLTWTNGKPMYQVQGKSSLNEPWQNIGAPTAETRIPLPTDGTQRFFRVVQDYTARYQVVFQATWSATSHPYDFPASAHWSGLVGGVHNDRVHFWREGEPASEGIQLMAERGRQTNLLTEVQAAIATGHADFGLQGGGIAVSPGTVTLTFPQPMRRNYPLVTLCSMVAPSPDWFVAVDSLSLLENDQWVDQKVAILYGYDAGTDSGASYSSPDQVTVPHQAVTRFSGFPALVNGEIVPFGTFTFSRLDL
jgi:hypothetical protein